MGNPVYWDPPHSIGEDLCPYGGHHVSCSDFENAVRTKVADSSNALTSTGLQLMSDHALKDAAEKAIAFIDNYKYSKSDGPV